MKIFILGASGYIGGTVAATLQSMGHEVVATARTPETAAALAARGIAATVSTLDDLDAIEALARTADAVVSAADADHRPSVEALVRGLSGSNKRLIHTSGSSLVATDSQGAFLGQVYDEDSLPAFVAEKQARAAIDELVRRSHGVVICPTLVYGRGLGLHADSIQVPMIERTAREHRVVPYIGRGDNVWSNVHIRDLADLYVLAFERAPAGAFLFAENGEASMRDVAEAIARRLALPAESIGVERGDALWGPGMARFGLASNSRVRAAAARRLGWQPRGASLFDAIAGSPAGLAAVS